jgi:hypothetical protein
VTWDLFVLYRFIFQRAVPISTEYFSFSQSSRHTSFILSHLSLEKGGGFIPEAKEQFILARKTNTNNA